MQRFASIVLLTFCCMLMQPAVACLNDMETQSYEEEFESDYHQQVAPVDEAPSSIALIFKNAFVKTVAGTGLLLVLFLAIRSDISGVKKV